MPLLAGPTSPPAGNYITNVSTNVNIQKFSVSSGTISTQLSLPYITPGQCTTVNAAGQVVGIACGSGAASIAVTTGNASGFNSLVSSPTAVVNFDSTTFLVGLKGASTAYVLPNPSSVTLQGNGITFSGLSASTASLAASVTALTASTNSLQAQFPVSMSTNTTGVLPVVNGGTGVTSPGLIAGTNIGSITGTWPNQTINALNTNTLPFPAGATNYAQINPASQQPGTVNVSSITVFSMTVGDGSTASPLNIKLQANNHANGSITGYGSPFVNGDFNIDYYTDPSSFYSRLRFTNFNLNSGPTNMRYRAGWNFEDATGHVLSYFNAQGAGWVINSTGSVTLYDGPTAHYVALKASNTITSNATYILPPADGSSGQSLTTDGNQNLSWQTVSGGSGVTVYPATATASFPYGFSASTGVFSSTVTVPALQGTGSGPSVMTVNGYSGPILFSTGTPTAGQCAMFASSYTAVGITCPTGGGGGSGSGTIQVTPQYQVPFMAIASSNVITSSANLTNNGSTITITGVNQIVETNVTTVTATGVAYVYTGSTITISAIQWPNGMQVSSPTASGGSSPGGSAYQVQYASSNGTSFAGSPNLTNNGSTITVSGVNQEVVANVSTITYSGVWIDPIGSTFTVIVATQVAIIAPITNSRALQISTAAAGPYLVDISTKGVINFQDTGSSPTLSGCGTGPTIVGSASAMTITGGTGATGCTVTFPTGTFTKVPVCQVTQETMSLVNALSYTTTATAVTITQTGMGTNKIDIRCTGRD